MCTIYYHRWYTSFIIKDFKEQVKIALQEENYEEFSILITTFDNEADEAEFILKMVDS